MPPIGWQRIWAGACRKEPDVPRVHPQSFDEEAAKAGVTTRVPAGVQSIRVRRIVGSAGKADKVGMDFLPVAAGPAQAGYRAIYKRMQAGETLPPIAVYQLGNRYFVIDGHTRVAAAKALGVEFIDADVTEALPRKEGDANLTFYARREFEQATGLEGIRLTSADAYPLLLRHLEGYRLYLQQSRGREVSLREASAIWRRSQYLPTLREIRRRKLPAFVGKGTAGDVYVAILKAWAADDSPPVSLREMLDRWDTQLRESQSTVTRARRKVSDIVDASLPKALTGVSTARSNAVDDQDVDAELTTLHGED